MLIDMEIMNKVKLFQMQRTESMTNLKTLAGETVRPITWLFTEYSDSDGTVHTVLALELENRGFYRTEAKAFITEFEKYARAFDDEEKKPAIKITTKNSKRGNPFINFELVDN